MSERVSARDVASAMATRALAIALCLALAACGSLPRSGGTPAPEASRAPAPGGGYYKDDGPGIAPPDLATIPDAVPRAEPLARAANRPYRVFNRDYVPMTALRGFREQGVASWYGRRYHGKRTSSGEPYDMFAMTAAHPTLPIPSYARVTRVADGRSVVVRVNDRGPFLGGRVIDLSYTAAWKLGYVQAGSAEVVVESILPGDAPRVAAAVVRARPAQTPIAPAAAPPSAPPASSVAARAATGARGVYLQLGAFTSQPGAEGMREQLRARLGWLRESLQVVPDEALYKLQLGPYGNRDDAQSIAERIASELNFRPFLVVR